MLLDVAALRAREFPVSERYVYLNHAALGALPRRTAAALHALVDDFSAKGVLAEARWVPVVERTRALVGRLLNVSHDEVVFVRNTSEALNIVAEGFPWRPGDVAITAAQEFPANVYAWLHLAQRGVETRFVPLRDGRIEPEDVAATIDAAQGRARLVSLSLVQYHNGFRCDPAAIGELCRQRGVLFGLDAIQGAGVVPLDLRALQLDFCAFGCHKWLLAPQGSGILYMGPALRAMLAEVHVGWLGVAWRDYNSFDLESPLMESSSRYEEGTRSLMAIAGVEQSLGLLMEIGIETVAARLLSLTERLAQGLLALGLELRTPLDPRQRAGIISCVAPGRDQGESAAATQALFEALKREQVVAALREGALRLSPHVYTDESEIQLVLDTLARARS